MATRGIYNINGVRCYNHWDNYPTGAARHLLDTILSQRKIDLFAMARAMPGLVQVFDDAHAEEEYEYWINSEAGTIQVYEVNDLKPVFQYQQTIEDFINDRMAEGEAFAQKHNMTTLNEGESLELIRVIKDKYGLYSTVKQLQEEYEAEFRTGELHLKNGGIGNASSSFKEAFDCLRQAGMKLDEKTRQYYTEVICPYFVKKYGHYDDKYFMSLIAGI